MATSPKDVVNDPELFAASFLRILDLKKQTVPLRWNRAQRDFHSKRTGKDLVLKARQLGFSTYIQGEMYRRTVTKTSTTLTLTHTDDTTAKLRIMADRFWKYCVFNGIQPSRQYANATMTTYPELDSAAYIGTAGNADVGRGDTYSDFHGSEVAFWKDAEGIMAGAMQGGDPDTILESTPNGAQGHFYNLCMEALEFQEKRKRGVWSLHFYPWWWDSRYQMQLEPDEEITLSPEEEELTFLHGLVPEQVKWRRYKQLELKRFFRQEFPEDPRTCFLVSGESYFGDISEAFVAPLRPEYDAHHLYVAGLDFGQTNDYTSMTVLDVTAKRMVDLLHIRGLEWSEQRKRVGSTYKRWNCRKMGVEMNSIGSVNYEELRKDGLNCLPFTTTNESKNVIMGDLYEGLHTGGWALQDIPELRHEMQIFVSTQTPTGLWRLAASKSGHDDTVLSLAIAKWAASVADWGAMQGLGQVHGYTPLGAEDNVGPYTPGTLTDIAGFTRE